MNIQSKHNGNMKMSLLQMLLKSTLVVGLSACNSPASQSNNVSEKGDKSMLNEIYQTKTSPGKVEMVENIVRKYFPIGSDKTMILKNLDEMKIDTTQDAKKNVVYVLHRDKPAYAPASKTLEISFYFDENNKLVRIFSRIYNTI